jgi:peptidoglycan/xylan/chitin deacetylase (PgdA/CDA1 family)
LKNTPAPRRSIFVRRSAFRIPTPSTPLALRLKVIGWTIRSLDTKLTDPVRIVQGIERGLKPGAVILLHDGNIPAERLVVTVKLLLTKLREHGYEVVRLDRMLG